MCLHSTDFSASELHILPATSPLFTNINYVVGYLWQTLHLMFTLCMGLSASIKSMTLTVAFVTLDACVLCMVSPLPACADSACLAVCVCVLTLSLCLSPLPLLPSHPHPSSHRPCVSDPGCLSAGGTADPGGRGLVRMPHPAPGQQKRRLSKRHMDIPLHHRCSTAGFWEVWSCSFRCSSLALSLFRTATAWSLAGALNGLAS